MKQIPAAWANAQSFRQLRIDEKPIGRGCTRNVYALGEHRVVKVAKRPDGILQNLTERHIGADSQLPDWVNPYLGGDPLGRWAIFPRRTTFRRSTQIFERWINQLSNAVEPETPDRLSAEVSRIVEHHKLNWWDFAKRSS